MCSFVLCLSVPFLMSAHIMAATRYLNVELPSETRSIWGESFLRPMSRPDATPVAGGVQLLDWLFGDFFPCSLMLGAATQFPDKTLKNHLKWDHTRLLKVSSYKTPM